MDGQTTETAIRREDVKEYLQQYHFARKKKRILEERHRALSAELNAPAPGSAFRTMPTSRRAGGDGPVSVVFRVSEVEERIEEQRQEMGKAVLRIMDLIDLLPPNSMERTVVEMRHIDCKKWERIAQEIHMSRSRIIDYYNAALDALLTYKRTRKVVEDFTAETEGVAEPGRGKSGT